METAGIILAIVGIIIALILGGAQVWSGKLALESTRITHEKEKLIDEISQLKEQHEKDQNKIRRYARQVYFLRFVEESVYAELGRTNTSYQPQAIKGRIHGDIANEIGIQYDSMDSDIKQDIEMSRNIEPIDIRSYIK